MATTTAPGILYPRVKIVSTLHELFNAQFDAQTNVIVLPRRLKGNFSALANHLAHVRRKYPNNDDDGILEMELMLLSRPGQALQEAAIQVAADLHMGDRLRMKHLNIQLLNAQMYLERDKMRGPFNDNRFHADSNTGKASFGRLMTCYNMAATEFVRNEDAAFLGLSVRNALERDLLASNARVGANRELGLSTRVMF